MRRAVVSLSLLAAACGGSGDAAPDAAPPDAPAPDAALPDAAPPDASLTPMTLEETGLYADFATRTLAPGVIEYAVNYPLWADGAEKRRFVLLPEGAAIDTSDMNFWRLPAGTRLWKEFTRDGLRVETRLLWKQGPSESDWFAMSFAWSDDEREALAAPDGQEDARGTPHDIPRAAACKTCHGRQPGFALGFSALQLDHDQGDMNLDALVAAGRLSDPPARSDPPTDPPEAYAPFFPLPGDPALDAPALGYLHGNCGPCHNEHSDVFADRTEIIWHLDVSSLATVEDTTIYRTTVRVEPRIFLGDQYTAVIEPGDRDASAALFRMTMRDPAEEDQRWMPPLASEEPDTEGGVAAVGAWIDALP